MSPYDVIWRDLHLLRSRPGASQIFGASTHLFQVHAPLSEEELQHFEAQHGVPLPSGYRDFLRVVGNGGAGPFYGVFKLGEMDDGFGHAPWNGFVGDLARPFAHTEAWNGVALPDLREGASEEEEDAHNARLEELEEDYWNPRHTDGAIPICHEGCALRLWLVVCGAEKGHVWRDARTDWGGLSPLRGATSPRVTFLQWYRAWLDEALAQTGKGSEPPA